MVGDVADPDKASMNGFPVTEVCVSRCFTRPLLFQPTRLAGAGALYNSGPRNRARTGTGKGLIGSVNCTDQMETLLEGDYVSSRGQNTTQDNKELHLTWSRMSAVFSAAPYAGKGPKVEASAEAEAGRQR